MKAVLISIRPKWCELIASGKKTIEVRKTRPKIATPFKCYIYCTIVNGVKGDYLVPSGIQCGRVIGEFICDKITKFDLPYPAWFSRKSKETQNLIKNACLTMVQAHHYLKTHTGYAWHISNLKIYDKAKELEYGEFYVWKKCNSCRDTGYESTACCYDINCKVPARINRPPQSWCYVEELEVEE